MKHKKSLLTVILMVILLTSAVSGTIAYLKTNTGTVTNVFQPSKVDTEITENFNQTGNKNSIVIKNKADSTSAFVRVAIVGNWCDSDGRIVEQWRVPDDLTLGTEWKKSGDYYYYTKALAAGGSTTNLLGTELHATHLTNSDLRLEITVMQQAIQSEPLSAVEQKWGLNPTTLQ